MAFPFVVQTVQTDSEPARKSHPFTVPPETEAGDLLIAWCVTNDGGSAGLAVPAGWGALGNTTSGPGLMGAWKIATGLETTQAQAFTSTANVVTAMACQLIRGHDPAVAPMQVSQGSADPPSVTPSWGLDDTLWLVVAGWGNNLINVQSWPAMLQGTAQNGVAGGASAGSKLAYGWRQYRAASWDPGVFVLDGTVNTRARTVAIKPVVPPPIEALFSWDVVGPLAVTFTDLSTGSPTTWHWDFGDGTSSPQPGVTSHVYAAAGTYTVTLTVSNDSSSDTFSLPVTVAVPSGRPELSLAVNDEDTTCPLLRASWSLGRDTWLARIEPGTASLELSGDIPIEDGDRVTLGSQYGPLWSGFVVDVETVHGTSGGFTTLVQAVDLVGMYGMSELKKVNVPAGTIIDKLAFLGQLDQRQATLTTGPSDIIDGTTKPWPSLNAQQGYEGGALQAVQEWEDNSNAVVVCLPGNRLVVQPRSALPAGFAYRPLPLVGPDCPTDWSRRRSSRNIVNDWQFYDSAGVAKYTHDYPESVAKYGRRSLIVDDALRNFPADKPMWLFMDVVQLPRFVVSDGTFRTHRADQRAYRLLPLDFIDVEGEDWQVLRVSHNVTPTEWTTTIAADLTQNGIEAVPDPEPEPEAPPTGTHLVTISGRTTKDSQLALTPAGVKAGAGTGQNLAVGSWQGFSHRALIGFPDLDFPQGTVGVKRATLTLRTSTQVQVRFGSSPKVVVQPVTSAWSEGSAASNSSSNAVVWPGPSVGSASVTKSVPRTENSSVSIDVTNLVAGMRGNPSKSFARGFRLKSANEGGTAATTELKARENANAAHLEVVCIVKD